MKFQLLMDKPPLLMDKSQFSMNISPWLMDKMDKSPLLMVIFLFFGCQIPDMYKFFRRSLLHQHLQRSIQRVSAKVAATVVAQGPIQCNPWRGAFHRIFFKVLSHPQMVEEVKDGWVVIFLNRVNMSIYQRVYPIIHIIFSYMFPL